MAARPLRTRASAASIAALMVKPVKAMAATAAKRLALIVSLSTWGGVLAALQTAAPAKPVATFCSEAPKSGAMPARMDILVGRIETLAFDAVVNAANRRLLPGTGVDGALRVAAGPALTRLTSTLPPLDVGAAIITPGFDAPARHIIHTAAPVWT